MFGELYKQEKLIYIGFGGMESSVEILFMLMML